MILKHISNCILFRYNPNPSKVFGFFDENDGKIYINETFGIMEREVVYLHELSHRECFEKGCWCWKRKSDYWVEYHGFRGEFYKVQSNGDKRLKKAYLKQLGNTIKKAKRNPKVWGCHFAALRRLAKMKSFRKFVNRKIKRGLC